jgi:hypothetical protein
VKYIPDLGEDASNPHWFNRAYIPVIKHCLFEIEVYLNMPEIRSIFTPISLQE